MILSLIAATTTTTGLSGAGYLDTNTYPTTVHISDEELAMVPLRPDAFPGAWTYTILPQVA